jgi:molybdopterin-guanine dinucleotide biosynthesis protein A
MSQFFEKVYLSTNSPEIFYYLGLPMIGDVVKEKGPMTGIYSAFVCTGARELFVVACDMPFIKGKVIEVIIGRYHGQDAVIPLHQGRPEPLFAVYSGRAQNLMGKMLQQGRRSLRDLLEELDAYYIDEHEILRQDPEGTSFVNINTLEEYRALAVDDGCPPKGTVRGPGG